MLEPNYDDILNSKFSYYGETKAAYQFAAEEYARQYFELNKHSVLGGVSTRIISGCSDCPMCDMNDMCSGYSCRLKEHPDNFIKESKKFQPITPKWCPIKQNDVLFKYGR